MQQKYKNNNKVMNRNLFILITLLLFCSILFCFLLFVDSSEVKKVSLRKMSENKDILWNIDNINRQEKSIKIDGWVRLANIPLNKMECKVILKCVNTKENIAIPTEMVERPDITATATESSIDKCFSGFCANVLYGKLDNKNKYEILINYRVNDENFIIYTGKHVRG